MDREAWRAVVHEVAKSQTWLSDWTDWQTLRIVIRMVVIKKKVFVRMWRNWNPVPYWFPVASMEKGTLVPQKIKIRITMQSSNSTSWYLPKRIGNRDLNRCLNTVFIITKKRNWVSINRLTIQKCVLYIYTQWNIIQPLILLLLNIINIIHPLKGRKFWHMLQYGRSLMISEISQSLKG